MIDKTVFYEKLARCLAANSLSEFACADTSEKLYSLTCRMLEVNEHMNLTAITDIGSIILKHYVDSLTAAAYIPQNANVIDVGCGAGFPSLVLAIARPDLSVTALDSTAKRINYIQETADLINLKNICCIAARAEELACDSNHREKYDVACARAVARLNVLCELCIPYVKIGGSFVAMKANAEDELAEASAAITKLGGALESANRFSLISDNPGEDNPRCIIVVSKSRSTPTIYPRNNSQIKKKPL